MGRDAVAWSLTASLVKIALKTNPDQAAPHFEKAISIFQEIKAENELALAYSGMGRYHKQQGNTEQAREYLTRLWNLREARDADRAG